MNRAICFLSTSAFFAASTSALLAWGEPHHSITKAAVSALGEWQKDMLGTEGDALASSYCMIPDNVYIDKDNAPFAAMASSPGEVYLQKLHLPQPEQTTNLETIRYFMDKAVASWRSGKTKDAARYMGTICHVIEDFGSPSHTVPGDNQFTLLQQFLPPTEIMRDTLLHAPIENGTFTVDIGEYKPRLLGLNVDEASWRLLHRIHECIINARSTTVPIILALYSNNEEERVRQQMKAAAKDAEVLADALHTILCLGADRFEEEQRSGCDSAEISRFWPVEAVHLFYPQSHFFGAPYWGHAHSGVTLEGGKKAIPLRLRVKDGENVLERTLDKGISTGMGKALSFHLPKGVFSRFRVMVGLQAGAGDKGRVEFSVLGDGKLLESRIVSGTDVAAKIECDVAMVNMLQLNTQSRGLDAKSNYAVWAEPTLIKDAP